MLLARFPGRTDLVGFNERKLPSMSLQSLHHPRPCIVICIVSWPAGMMCVGVCYLDGETGTGDVEDVLIQLGFVLCMVLGLH